VGKGGGKWGLTTFSLHANTASSTLLGDGSRSNANGSKSNVGGLAGCISVLSLVGVSMWSMVSGG
jgi:hypothetical protein